MKHTRGLALLLSGSVFFFSSLGLSGCSEDDKTTEPDEPVFPAETPSPATMRIDLDGLSGSGRPILSGPCFNSSVLLVGVANIMVVLVLATPVAVLGTTIESEPVYIGDQTWRWSASGGTGADAWSSQFEGYVANSSTVEWTMRVSGTRLDLEDFTWYTGISESAAGSGSWKFYDPLDLAEIDETMSSTYADVSADTGTLTFENRNDDGVGFGDTLVYNAAGDDLSVSFFSASKNATLTVEWNRSTGAGTQTDFQGQTCCWGARPDYDDARCP